MATKEKAAKANTLTIEDVNKTLEDSLQSVFESNRYQELLEVMSRQKQYSLNNMLLIAAQRPSATRIMGFKEWQKIGRFVNKGEKGIRILAPVTGKLNMEKIDPITQKPVLDDKGEVVTELKNVIRGFRMVSVFDVAQTNGKEIPSVRDFIAREMADDAYMSTLYHNYKNFLIETKGADIREDQTERGVGGFFRRMTDEIVISNNNNHTDTEKFRVLIHEYAHSQLHHKESKMKDLPREHKEAQAESVAFVVSNYFGLDTTAVSAGYIATWSRDMKLAKQALNEIQSVANTIIDDINRLQKDKIQEFYADKSSEHEAAKQYLIDKVGLPEQAFRPDEMKDTQLQLINKDNGFILSGKIEYSEKNDNFYLRTNRNLIEPLSELEPEKGKLALLNVEKEQGEIKEMTAFSRIPEHYEVKEIKQGIYAIQSVQGESLISKTFEKREDAQEFHLRAAMSQSLHQDSSLKKAENKNELKGDLERVSSEVKRQVNEAVGHYLSHHSRKNLAIKGEHGVTIGWALLKNPLIKTDDQLKDFTQEHQHVPSYTKLPEALEHIEQQEVEQEKLEEPRELEHSIER